MTPSCVVVCTRRRLLTSHHLPLPSAGGGGGDHRLLTTLCPPSPCLAYLDLSTHPTGGGRPLLGRTPHSSKKAFWGPQPPEMSAHHSTDPPLPPGPGGHPDPQIRTTNKEHISRMRQLTPAAENRRPSRAQTKEEPSHNEMPCHTNDMQARYIAAPSTLHKKWSHCAQSKIQPLKNCGPGDQFSGPGVKLRKIFGTPPPPVSFLKHSPGAGSGGAAAWQCPCARACAHGHCSPPSTPHRTCPAAPRRIPASWPR